MPSISVSLSDSVYMRLREEEKGYSETINRVLEEYYKKKEVKMIFCDKHEVKYSSLIQCPECAKETKDGLTKEEEAILKAEVPNETEQV